MGQYLRNVLVALDQLLNALAGGDPDETISSRVGKAAGRGERWGVALQSVIDWIFWRGHCRDSEEPDEGGDAVVK